MKNYPKLPKYQEKVIDKILKKHNLKREGMTLEEVEEIPDSIIEEIASEMDRARRLLSIKNVLGPILALYK